MISLRRLSHEALQELKERIKEQVYLVLSLLALKVLMTSNSHEYRGHLGGTH